MVVYWNSFYNFTDITHRHRILKNFGIVSPSLHQVEVQHDANRSHPRTKPRTKNTHQSPINGIFPWTAGIAPLLLLFPNHDDEVYNDEVVHSDGAVIRFPTSLQWDGFV